MADEKISEVIDYLSSSIHNNEVTNVDKLTLAIDELDHFPMTFDILDSSRVGQILQSIRHSKEISIFIKERIRSLIKCWRHLLNVDTLIVIPNEIKSKMSKTPAVKNGYANGFIPDDIQINGINTNNSKIYESIENGVITPCTIEKPAEEIITSCVTIKSNSSDINCVIINSNNKSIDQVIEATNCTINENIGRDETDFVATISNIETHVERNFEEKIGGIINEEVTVKNSTEDIIIGELPKPNFMDIDSVKIDKSINSNKAIIDESINSNACIFKETLNDKLDVSIMSASFITDESINSSNGEIDESINSNTCKIDESVNNKLDECIKKNLTDFTITNSENNNIEEQKERSSLSIDSRGINDEPIKENSKYERKSSVLKININKESNTYFVSENDLMVRSRNISNSSKVNDTTETQINNNPIPGKPKVKSTKELLADFSNFIENDIKNKILMDKISQEDDEPISYFPNDAKIKELVQMSLIQEKYNNKTRQQTMPLRRRRTESIKSSEPEEVGPSNPKCAMLLKMFNEQCTKRPQVVLKHFVPWPNLKRGLQMHPPEIKLPFSKRRRLESVEQSVTIKPPPDPVCMNVINNLLESFEVRAQQKQMISDAIQQRKEQTKIIDNTLSLVDMSLKLKLKIPKVPTIKIRRKKKRKKKLKIKPIKVKVKKPRKPYIRPMPPITNYLDDIPLLPALPPDIDEMTCNEEIVKTVIEYTEENITQLVYGVLEGYNCTKNAKTAQIYQFTSMYSDIINKHYLHVFPWVDLDYPAKTTFPTDSNQLLQSIIDIQSFYS